MRFNNLSVPERHQLRIAKDTVKNPLHAFMGGPSETEARKTLKEIFGWTEKEIEKLSRSA